MEFTFFSKILSLTVLQYFPSHSSYSNVFYVFPPPFFVFLCHDGFFCNKNFYSSPIGTLYYDFSVRSISDFLKVI